jgi:hypothetical protein
VRPCFGSAVILHFGFRDRFAFFSWILATGSVRIFFGFARPGTRFPFSAVASQSWCFFSGEILLPDFIAASVSGPRLVQVRLGLELAAAARFFFLRACLQVRLFSFFDSLLPPPVGCAGFSSDFLSHAHRYLPPILRSLSRSVSAILGLR